MIVLIIYIIGFILNPILMIYLDKVFPNSMQMDTDSFGPAISFGSFLWPLTIFVEAFLLLEYWYNLK